MFATLIGPYPSAAGPATAVELAEIGLEPVSDGHGPRVVGPGDEAATVDAWRTAADATPAAVKQSLLGPFSAAARAGGDALAHAEAIGATVAALTAAGCPLVEIEEPDAVGAAGDDAARTILFAALGRLADTVGERIHLSLVLTGGNVDGLGASALFDLPFASYAFDLIAGPDNWRLIAEAPGDRGIVCGALDPSSTADNRPEPLVWAAHYAASTRGRGLARVGLANASSLAGLDRVRARRKLEAVVEAARLASLADPRELAGQLDPRAVDSRSAALGAYDPRRRGGR
jgi:methionine synthase II (cobalamin-independent)